jgi:thiamine biosynthesis lipoprotein
MVPNRRRFIAISAAVLGLAAGMPGRPARAEGALLHRWSGTALGAEASILLYHFDAAEARALFAACIDEIERLEAVFSLYRADSAVTALNRAGRLDAPPLDLIHLLHESRRFSELSGGAFDITVQPLWALHARPGRPRTKDIAASRALVDYRGIEISGGRIAFARPGMAITMNGIAQGYITDRVSELLRARGMGQVLVNLGEIRALGPHPSGRPWRVALERPPGLDGAAPELDLSNGAVATSAAHGHWFDEADGRNHLFDPASGMSPRHYASVSVVAPSATTADALSTALSILPPAHAGNLLARAAPATAYVTEWGGAAREVMPDPA